MARAKAWHPKGLVGASRQYDPLTGLDAYGGRFQLEHRRLYLVQAIAAEDDEDTVGVSSLIVGMQVLDAMEPGRPITLYVNSPGGDVVAGLALTQAMRDLRSPVHTFVLGMAASMAAIVAVAGAKRYAYPAARWLLHRSKVEDVKGDREDILIEARELEILDRVCDEAILNFTKIRRDHLEEMRRKDFWIGTKEALRWGLVDEVVVPLQGPQSWLPSSRRRKAGGQQ